MRVNLSETHGFLAPPRICHALSRPLSRPRPRKTRVSIGLSRRHDLRAPVAPVATIRRSRKVEGLHIAGIWKPPPARSADIPVRSKPRVRVRPESFASQMSGQTLLRTGMSIGVNLSRSCLYGSPDFGQNPQTQRFRSPFPRLNCP